MVQEHGEVIELDLIVLSCESMRSDGAEFDCLVMREHEGVIELDLIGLWCETMGSD